LAFITNYEASDYVIFFILLLLFFFLDRNIFLSALCSKELSVLFYLWQTKFHTHIEQEKNSFAVREILKNPATTQLIARSKDGVVVVVVVVVGLMYVLLSKKFCQSCGTQRLTSLLSLQLQSSVARKL
jgi:hypothetical protein